MLKKFIAITSLALMPLTAGAATLGDGVYDALNMLRNGNERMVWGVLARGHNDGTEKLWAVDPGATFTVSNSGQDARLEGSVKNLVDTGLAFAFDLTFKLDTTGPNPGYCQFDGTPDPGCNNAYSTNLINNNIVDPTEWTYYDIVTGAFTGSDKMAGLTYTVTDKTGGAHRPQAGESANALVIGNLGMSFWFNYFLDGGVEVTQNGYTFRSSGDGDFNFDLNEVPLPAGVWMLLAALGGLGIAGRKRAAA